jgi:hypothetical protein
MQPAIRRRVPLAALALVAPLMLSTSSTESAAGEVGDHASGAANTCEAPATATIDRRVAPMARIRGEGAPADANFVVLNGRGYNYGAPDPADFDRVQLEALMAEIESQRKLR